MQISMALRPYPILRLTFPLATGIFLSDVYLRPFHLLAEHVALAAILFAMLMVLLRQGAYRRRWAFGVVVSAFLLVLGSLATQLAWAKALAGWEAENSGYKGIVSEKPVEKEKTYCCKVEVRGKQVLFYVPKDSLSETLKCGDEVFFYARISPPRNAGNPYEFDYASWLRRKYISGTAYAASGFWKKTGESHGFTLQEQALECRRKIIALYKSWGFSGQELAVLSALTVGYKEDLSDELQESYAVAGISHVLALSGLHVGILWGLLNGLLVLGSRKKEVRVLKWAIITALLWGYAFIAGLAASVVRSVIMCMLAGLAQLASDRRASLNVLGAAAFFMLLYNPFYLFDVSFQLSFMAVLAILLLYPRFYRLYATTRSRFLKYVWGIVAVSVAAQLGTAPLVMYYFSSFSVYFLLANLIIAPLVFAIMYMAVGIFILSPFPVLHIYMVEALEKAVGWLNGVAEWVSRLPHSSIGSLYPTAGEVWLLYAVLGVFLVYWATGCRKALVGLLGTCLLFLSALSYHRFSAAEDSPSIIFYNLRNCSAIHFIDTDKTSYLSVNKADSAFVHLKYVSRTYWDREKLPAPRLLASGYENGTVWNYKGITHWQGVNVCMLDDNFWNNKKAGKPLEVDYMYLCKGYKGKIAPLEKVFKMKRIVLDASLGAYRLENLKKECDTLHIDYIDMSEKGSFRILL